MFSTEHFDSADFCSNNLGAIGIQKYTSRVCVKHGYTLRHFETQPLRKEKNQYIRGGLYILGFKMDLALITSHCFSTNLA